MVDLISFFRARVDRTVRSWPDVIRIDIQKYLSLTHKKLSSGTRLRGNRTDLPYWILLPFWLKEKFGRRNAALMGKGFLHDILWGQYCLFIFIRIQDDLFDKHTGRIPLIYASDLFLFEAERVFSKYFRKSSAFWNIYRNCIEETILAVASGDSIEHKPVKNRTQLISAHGRTSGICNIAPVAVCLKAGRMRYIKRVTIFSAEMMKAGAIVDDLHDLEEDLNRGRFNYVSSFFLQGINIRKSVEKNIYSRIYRNIFISDGLAKVFEEINRHITLAEKALYPFAVQAAFNYIKHYTRSIARLENDIHRQRVREIFGKLRGGSE